MTCRSTFDVDGPKITGAFYEHLCRTNASTTLNAPEPFLDVTQAAEALHIAVAKLRSENHDASFAHWVPFIHLGK